MKVKRVYQDIEFRLLHPNLMQFHLDTMCTLAPLSLFHLPIIGRTEGVARRLLLGVPYEILAGVPDCLAWTLFGLLQSPLLAFSLPGHT